MTARHAPMTVNPHDVHRGDSDARRRGAGQRAIVSGWLDQLTGSTRSFRLRLANGQALRGFLPPGEGQDYGRLWNKKVVARGSSFFLIRPSRLPSGNGDVIFTL